MHLRVSEGGGARKEVQWFNARLTAQLVSSVPVHINGAWAQDTSNQSDCAMYIAQSAGVQHMRMQCNNTYEAYLYIYTAGLARVVSPLT